MITLYQFRPIWNLPNASPFCMKLETYLRLAALPYDTKFIDNSATAPKGKLPYIQIDGQNYSDSEFIIDELKNRYGDSLDNELTPEQQALAVLIDQAFCERLYWVIVYLRWKNDTGWALVEQAYFKNLPALVKLFLPSMIRRKMLKALDAQGTGRHSLNEVVKQGCKTIDALAQLLGDKPYFLGDKPTSVDATAFAFIVNILDTPVHDALQEHVLKIESFKGYSSRMWDEFYANLEEPTQPVI